jgi:hypothetical protein
MNHLSMSRLVSFSLDLAFGVQGFFLGKAKGDESGTGYMALCLAEKRALHKAKYHYWLLKSAQHRREYREAAKQRKSTKH